MEFATTLDTLDAVPENVRVFYTQDAETKKWNLQETAEVKAAVSVIAGQGAVLKKVRLENDTLAKGKIDLSPLADFGEDPLAIKASIEERIKAAQGAASDDIEKTAARIREEMNKGHSGELESRDQRLAGLQKQLFTLMGTGEAKKELLALGAADVDLAMPFVLERLKTIEEHGELDVRVVDADGEIKYGTTGRPMTVKELVTEMKGNSKYGLLFKSDTPQGGGTPPGAPSRTPPAPGKPELTSTQKIAEGLKKGQHQTPGREAAANAAHQ